MESVYLTLISVVCCTTAVAVYAWKVVDSWWIRPRRTEKLLRQQGFRGNSYRFMFGDSKEMAAMHREARAKPIAFEDDIKPRIMPFVIDTLRKYGNESFVWMGPKAKVIITDTDLIKEVMSNNYTYLKQSSPKYPMMKKLLSGLALHEFDKWAKHRKIINPAFHLNKLKLMVPAFYTSCEELLNKWETQISRRGSCEIDVWPCIQNLTGEVISRTAFGSNFEEGRKVFELLEEQKGYVMKIMQTIHIPGWRFLSTKMNKRMKAIEKEVKSLILCMIEKRMKAIEVGAERMDDLLTLLLGSNLQEIEKHGDKSHGMSINEVIEECQMFYLAGQKTTSVLIVWTLILLSKYKDWQTRARDEVLKVFGDKNPDYDGSNSLKLVTMILLEVMRLYPPATYFMRRLDHEAKLGNLTMPAGVEVLLPIIVLHHDRETWGDDAMDFNPVRFDEGVSKAQKGKGMYFPFGWGPRICVGQTFAMLEAKIALAMILRRFAFELSPSYTHAPEERISLVPQHGAHLVLHKI
ncbi:cytochrome P450 CYP72A219-like isoform X2 [Henckelia pumila]|uniref:cytochrome P450 CYP72A219-like isoform X2 n=1 Tax=Henckelia pumila TaxID=405737 RepID=UPI003C6E38D8